MRGTVMAWAFVALFALPRLGAAQEPTGDVPAEAPADVAADAPTEPSAPEEAPATGRVVFVVPPDVTNLEVKLDGRALTVDELGEALSVDVGSHRVHAEGVHNGARVSSDEDFEIAAGQLIQLKIGLTGTALTTGMSCMVRAKTAEEVQECLPAAETFAQVALETSGYVDTQSIAAFAPHVRGAVFWPHWALSGSYGVDVVSAASPDVVTGASRFTEARHLGRIGFSVMPGRCGLDGKTHLSREPDALSMGAGIVASCGLADRGVTPRLGFHYTSDTIGLRGVPFEAFHRHVGTYFFELGAVFILFPATTLNFGLSAEVDDGDSSNPYRNVAIFDPQSAARIREGDALETVNSLRLPTALPEALPSERKRYAAGLRLSERYGGTEVGSTLRLEGRLYGDTWGLDAVTLDGRYIHDFSSAFTLGPHIRLHAQTGVNFWRLAYVAPTNATPALLSVSEYRTSSWGLGPLATFTLGLSGRLRLSSRSRLPFYALVFQADGMTTHHYDALFMTDRWAASATTGLEANF